MDCNMSLKLHVLMSHLECFADNLGEVSDEKVEKFQQYIAMMERIYKASGSQQCLQTIVGC